MGKFIVLYHASASANQQMANSSPEEMQEGMQAWMKWAEKCGSGLVDMGTPLANGQSVTTSGTVAIAFKKEIFRDDQAIAALLDEQYLPVRARMASGKEAKCCSFSSTLATRLSKVGW
jgi:hypothetical protein